MQLYTSISEYWNNSNAAFPTFVPQRLYIHKDIRTIARNTTFFTVSGPFFAAERWNGQTRTVCGKRRVKSDGKEFLTFCRVSSRCESMSPASFGNRDSARSAATPSFSPPRASLSLSDGMKSGCNLNSKNEREGRDIFDRSLDEFIVSRSRWLRLVGKLCCARARMRESNSVRVYILTSISEHSPFRKLCAAGRSTAKNHEIGKGR